MSPIRRVSASPAPGNISARPTPTASKPAALADQPLSWPRARFGIVLPMTSLDDTEQKPRARLKSVIRPRMAQPAAAPSSCSATKPMLTMLNAWTTLPATHTHLRIARRRMIPPTNSCGISEPDSRIGTSQPSTNAGAPTAVVSHASVVFGLAIASPSLVRK